MPHTRAKSTILYTFLLCQLFLNVIFTNGAVIRREKREILANVTGVTPANNEVSFATTEEAPRTNLLGTGSHDGSNTTDVSGGKKESTTLTGSTVDENTVSLSIDDHGAGKDKDSLVKSTKIWDERTQKQVEEVVLSEGTTASNDKSVKELETSTIESGSSRWTTTGSESNTASESFLREGTTSLGDVAKVDGTTVLRNTADESSTVRMTVDSATTVIGAKTDDANDSKMVIEELPPSTVKIVPTTDVTTGKALTETTDGTGKTSDDIPVTIGGAKTQHENVTDDALRYQSDVSSSDKSEVTTRLLPSVISVASSTSEQSTFLTETSPSEPSSTQPSKNLTNDPLNLTSTGKSDETTVILTSTEVSDENPLQTTDFASTNSQDIDQEIKNSTPPLSEKRGKFIDDNYSSANELHLPNNSDVWALAGMKTGGKPKSSELQNSVETSDEKAINNSMVTKSLLDWSRVMMTTDSMESIETTIKMSDSTTNDRSEDQATTEIRIQGDNEVYTSTKNSQTDATPEAVSSTDSKKGEIELDASTKEPPSDTTSEAVKVTDRMNTEESTSHTTEEIVDLTDRMDVEANTTDTAVEAVSLTDRMDIEESTSNQTTTPSKTGTTTEDVASDDDLLKDIDDTLSITATPESLLKGHIDSHFEDNQLDGDSTEEELPLATTTKSSSTTAIPVKSETTVSGETAIGGGNTGTIATSTLSHFDFTTSVPFLTSKMTTIKTTPEQFAFNMDDRTSEVPNKASTTLTPPSGSGQEATVESATTTTTPIPAVTVMPATTETQTIAAVAHTPTIISINDTMTQKSSSDSNYNNNYDMGSTPTTTTTQNSSVEAFEVSTRVAPSNWAVSTPTEVADRLDDSDVTTASNFDSNNNAYEIIVTPETSSTTGSTLTFATPTTVIRSTTAATAVTEDLDSIHKISETSLESNVIDPLHVGEASTTTTTTAATSTDTSQENMRMQSTGKGGLVDFTTTTTTTSTSTTTAPDDSTTTLQSISTKKEDVYSIVPTIDNGGGYYNVPKVVEDDATTTTTIAGVLSGTMDGSDAGETDVNVIIAISVSAVGIVALILLVAFLYVMRKRQKQMSYGQRCRPVSLDAYSLDNVSVYNSVRRKGATLRASKRSYGNVAFDDPSLRHNVLGTHELAKYVEKKSSIWEEFKDVPQIIARADEVPAGCEDKNRYANVIPLPETRVILQQQNGDEKSEYINANYVRGPKDTTNYYIACQAPLETTVTDFWRMIWEQNSRVIIMATDLIENGIDKCAEYLPPSVTLDNHTVFGDYQVTLKNREVKEKYAISTLMLKNTATEESREITHYWYQWPEAGVPTDEAAVIAMLLEARSSLKMYTIEPSDTKTESTIITEDTKKSKTEINGNVAPEKLKPPPRDQGPLTIHCSPGTGRTGTILACDIAMRCLEEPKRSVDIPQIVYSVRRGRASAVQTKEQYEFIYKVTHMYATKITNINNDN